MWNQSGGSRRELPASQFNKVLTPGTSASGELTSWWRAYELQNPAMAAMAKDFLAIQATSAPSERAFSFARHVVTEFRASLAPDTIRAILCLKTWLGCRDVEEEDSEGEEEDDGKGQKEEEELSESDSDWDTDSEGETNMGRNNEECSEDEDEGEDEEEEEEEVEEDDSEAEEDEEEDDDDAE